MPNPYVNKVQLADGTSVIDISDTTATASDVASGKYFYAADGAKTTGTGSGGGGDYTRTEICPTTTFSVSSAGGYTALTNSGRLTDATDYIVTYDGTEYVCTSRELWGSDRFLGDIALTWNQGAQSDYINPFCVEDWDSNNEPVVYARDTSSHTIKIERLDLLNSGVTLLQKTITANGTYAASSDSADGYDSVTVSIPSGTAGTPTATKSAVSNHALTVTPSVTNVGGLISSGTLTGTAVSVAASELVSGSETKTANGTYDVTNLAQLIVNVSGGASNVATGTFKGTTTGAAMDVTLNYTGSGYPLAVIIYPTGGPYNSNGTFYNLLQRYAISQFMYSKSRTEEAPSYPTSSNTDAKNYACGVGRYKSSSSNASQYSQSYNNNIQIYYNTDAIASSSQCVRFKSATKMSVYIASTSYGFAANYDYKYWVIYSS